MKIFSKLIVLLLFFLLSSFVLVRPAHAMVSEWNTDFGTDGHATYDAESTNFLPYDVVADEDGSVYVAVTTDDGVYHATVLKYTNEGILDASFATGGVFTYVSENDSEFNSLYVQADGKLLIAGYASNGSDFDILVIRLNSDGSYDDSFATNGIFVRDSSLGDDIAYTIVVQNDSKIIVGGQYTVGLSAIATLIRLNEDGTLDETFADGGFFSSDFGLGYACYIFDIAIQEDGAYVVNSYHLNRLSSVLILGRITSDGTIDTTFSGDGIINLKSGIFSIGNVGISSSDQILVTYGDATAFSEETHIFAYDSTGVLDPSFGTAGTTVIAGVSAPKMSLMPTDKLLFFNTLYGATGLTLRVLNADGTVDTSFTGTEDPVTFDIEDHGSYGSYALAGINSQGNIYIAWVARNLSDNYDDVFVSNYKFAYQISNLASNLVAEDLSSYSIESGSSYGSYGPAGVLVRTFDGYPLILANANFDADLDWTSLSGDVDFANRRSFVKDFYEQIVAGDQENRISAQGAYGSYILYVPKAETDDHVVYCIYAMKIDDVTRDCLRGSVLELGDPGVSVVTIGGQTYWAINALVDAGAMSYGVQQEEELPDTGQTLVLSTLLGLSVVFISHKKNKEEIA